MGGKFLYENMRTRTLHTRYIYIFHHDEVFKAHDHIHIIELTLLWELVQFVYRLPLWFHESWKR